MCTCPFTRVQACASGSLLLGYGACIGRKNTVTTVARPHHSRLVVHACVYMRLPDARKVPMACAGRRSTSREPPGLGSRLWWS